MHALRLWILGVAAGSFAAGVVVGHTFTHAANGVEAAPEDVQYVRDLTERYGLSPDQQRRLHLVLQFAREREITILRTTQASLMPDQEMGELKALRAATEQRVRKLLDDEQRRRYDRDSRPGAGTPATAPGEGHGTAGSPAANDKR